MRLNMHRETPALQKVPENLEKALLILMWGLLGFPFLISAGVCLYERQTVIGFLHGGLGILVGLLGTHLYMSEKRSFVEIKGGEIRAVEYICCRPRERSFKVSQIGEIRRCYIRYGKSSLPYIRVSDRYGREMFNVYCCPESERALGELIDMAKE